MNNWKPYQRQDIADAMGKLMASERLPHKLNRDAWQYYRKDKKRDYVEDLKRKIKLGYLTNNPNFTAKELDVLSRAFHRPYAFGTLDEIAQAENLVNRGLMKRTRILGLAQEFYVPTAQGRAQFLIETSPNSYDLFPADEDVYGWRNNPSFINPNVDWYKKEIDRLYDLGKLSLEHGDKKSAWFAYNNIMEIVTDSIDDDEINYDDYAEIRDYADGIRSDIDVVPEGYDIKGPFTEGYDVNYDVNIEGPFSSEDEPRLLEERRKYNERIEPLKDILNDEARKRIDRKIIKGEWPRDNEFKDLYDKGFSSYEIERLMRLRYRRKNPTGTFLLVPMVSLLVLWFIGRRQ